MNAIHDSRIQHLTRIARAAFQGIRPNATLRNDDAVRRLLDADCAWPIHRHASIAVLLVAYETLPAPDDWMPRLHALRAHLPWGAFAVFAVDRAHHEAIAVSFGDPDPIWVSRSSDTLALPERGRILDAFADADEPLVLVAELAHILASRAPGASFYRGIARSIHACTDAWEHADGLTWSQRRELAILFVARLMFVFFVQHKGWLPHRQFVLRMAQQAEDGLYDQWLRPLFFDALNTPPDARRSGVIPRTVPYLNGGLFAPHALEVAHPALSLPDAVARRVIVQAFAPFRFVDDEAHTDLTSVRPHMLGEVFERLMCEDERHQTGAYYTPPALADDLAREALLTMVRLHVSLSAADALRNGTALRPADARALQRYLPTLRILDPAVGTGAFLLACLLHLEAWLIRCAKDVGAAPPDRAALRLHLITHCLHGVDVQPTAVLLAELRLWLALASVLPNHRDAAIPLPNIAHRLRVGDSVGPAPPAAFLRRPPDDAPEAQQRYHQYQEHQAELRALLASFSALRGAERQDAALRMQTIERALSSLAASEEHAALYAAVHAQAPVFADAPLAPHQRAAQRRLQAWNAQQARASSSSTTGTFHAHLHFADVMHEGGFDLVIANPPWLSIAQLPAARRHELRQQFSVLQVEGARAAAPDLSVAFLEHALPLLKPTGCAAFLLPAKAIRAGWGRPFRRFLTARWQVDALTMMDTSSTHGFRASAYPARLIVRPLPPGATSPRHPALPQDDAHTDIHGGYLRDHYTIRYGIKTGANRVFVDPPQALPHTVPAVRGRDLGGDGIRQTSRLLCAHDPSTGRALPTVDAAVVEYLRPAEAVLRARSDWRPHDPDWCVYRIYPESFGWRVAWPDIAQRMHATVLPPVQEGGPLCLNTVYMIGMMSEEAASRLATWLNAEPQQAWLRARAQIARNGYFRFDARVVGALPRPAFLGPVG